MAEMHVAGAVMHPMVAYDAVPVLPKQQQRPEIAGKEESGVAAHDGVNIHSRLPDSSRPANEACNRCKAGRNQRVTVLTV